MHRAGPGHRGRRRAALTTTPDAPSNSGVVGRERELAALEAFLADDVARALVLVGWPGIGKTTLWEAAIAGAKAHGVRVLSSRPSDAEARLLFGALIDVLDPVGTEELAGLPAPQLEALEIALLRRSSTDGSAPANATAVGLLSALRALSERDRLLVALDDVQWLDAASASALAFAARRLDGDRVQFLLARRPGRATGLEQALEPNGTVRLELGGLSLGGTRRLLLDRLGLSLSRPALRRIHDATLGNPLFALEVGRTLVVDGVPSVGAQLPVPERIEELLGTRVAALPAAPRRLLTIVALSPDLRLGQIRELDEEGALAAAVEAGVLVVDGDHVRASHPLVAAAAARDCPAQERRALHRRVADAVSDDELRARHLALAAEEPDSALAATVSAAAATAARRGAAQAAAELADHALRLTPPDDPVRVDRLLELGAYLEIAGEKQRMSDLLAPVVDSLPPGPARARGWFLLTGGEVKSNREILDLFERALAESTDDPRLRAAVLGELAANVAAVRVERIRMTEAWAEEALALARSVDEEAERPVLYAVAWARSLSGRPVDDLCERFRALTEASAFYMAPSPERVAAQRLVWRGCLLEARDALTRLLDLADQRGEPSSYALQRLHVCELELRAGGWDVAERLLDEWAESSDSKLLLWPMYERCRALLAAGRGDATDAHRWAEEAIARAKRTGSAWDRLEATRAQGIACLLSGEPGRAAEALRWVWTHTEREGVHDPGAFPAAPELVKALVELGELDEAAEIAARLAELAEAQSHPWGRATAGRCAALIDLASAYHDEAVEQLEEAAREYDALGLRFDAARSRLALGRAQRRHRKWGAARDTLRAAAEAFDALGSPGWAALARADLERVGARRPSREGELSAAERRVAELAAGGSTNKEIAQALVVTVSTVEYHLSKIYAKLGIRSRGQLRARLGAQAEEPQDRGR
ncbi:MAG TPA: AAA family ATPase [Gaiella sp.]|nr:AAA family ATPase [Gaiella sp.]